MHVLVCAIATVCCVSAIRVHDSSQSKRIRSDNADLRKSAANYAVSETDNLRHPSGLGRYGPALDDFDFDDPVISRLNKEPIDYRFTKPAPFDSLYPDEDLDQPDFDSDRLKFPKGLPRRPGVPRLHSLPGSLTPDHDFEVLPLDELGHGLKGTSSSSSHGASSSSSQEAKGHSNSEAFDSGSKAEAEKSNQQGGHEVNRRVNQLAENEVGEFAGSRGASKGEQSSSHGKSEARKKGHKTSGFHNVYRKDEYKKDTSFYDDEHVSHHAEEEGSQHSGHEEVEGSHRKKEDADSSYFDERRGRAGSFRNGHQYGSAEGHGSESGREEEFNREASRSESEHRKAN